MKKLTVLILFSIIIFYSNYIKAQINFTPNFGSMMPIGSFASRAENGYGFTAAFDYSLPKAPVAITFSAGYCTWDYKTKYITAGTFVLDIIHGYVLYSYPVTIGARYFINPAASSSRIYIGIDAGAVFTNTNEEFSSTASDFIYSPVVGYRYSLLPQRIALDINLKIYHRISLTQDSEPTSMWIGINAGLSFRI